MAKGKTYKAVHQALRNWHNPNRDGLHLFAHLYTPRTFGYYPNSSIIDGRIAIDNMLKYFMDQIAKLKPYWTEILERRFMDKDSIKRIAHRMHISEDHLNRSQADAIKLIAELIEDEERRNFEIVLEEN